ncbi:MAG TPA: hypothetical protein VFB78_09810 [Acidimicrobiales bacterium]|nr:hypothetical protein [Acidimicrobiales bacterium]
MSRGRVAALILAVIVGMWVAATINDRRPARIGRDGSTALSAGQPVGFGPPPPAYSIQYRLEERVSGAVRVSTERFVVRRPFDAVVAARRGQEPESLDRWILGRSAIQRPGSGALVSAQPPDAAAPDIRLDTAVADALRVHHLERRERREVAGRTCQVFRSRDSLIAASLYRATTKRYVDSCVDHDGLLLEELVVKSGTRDVRRVAVKVDTTGTPSDDTFAIGPPTLDVKSGGGSTRPVDPASVPPGQFWQLDQPPAGFTLVGRFAVVPPQPENFSDATREGFRRASVSDVFTRGVDIVVVDRGATLQGQPVWQVDRNNESVDLGAVGPGEIVLSGRQAEVRALIGGGRYVRVFGTIAAADLAAIARQLHLVPGGTLRYLD